MTRVLKQAPEAGAALRLPLHAAARLSARAASHHTRDSLAPGAQQAEAAAPDAAAIEAEMRELRERAMRDGYAQGRAQAEKELRAAIEAEKAQWRSGLGAIEAAVLERIQAVEPMAVAVGFHAMAAVLGESYAQHDAIVGAVRQLLSGASASAPTLKVQVAPAQLERVRVALEQGAAQGERSLQFEADPALSPTECRVVSEHGRLETGLALQLQAVQEALLRAHHARGALKDAL